MNTLRALVFCEDSTQAGISHMWVYGGGVEELGGRCMEMNFGICWLGIEWVLRERLSGYLYGIQLIPRVTELLTVTTEAMLGIQQLFLLSSHYSLCSDFSPFIGPKNW